MSEPRHEQTCPICGAAGLEGLGEHLPHHLLEEHDGADLDDRRDTPR